MFDTPNTHKMSIHRKVLEAMRIASCHPEQLYLFIEQNHAAIYIALCHEAHCKDPQNCTAEELATSLLDILKECIE